jgi:NAD(P)H-hydrate epimerase
MKVLTADAMRAVDERAIVELGVPSLVLMENAALGVVEALLARFPAAAQVGIFCGPGNNGGDGLAVARHLLVRGLEPSVWLLRGGRPLSPDAERQLSICRALAITVHEVADGAALAAALAAAARLDVVVDALFGTGLVRPLEGHFAAAVAGLDELPVPLLAVDLPSGLDAGSHLPPGAHLRAELTVTFAALKIAHVLPPAALACGEVVVTDLGVPAWLVEEAAGAFELLVGEELAGLLPARSPAAHKGDLGHLLVVAGSPGKSGAAILAARAAVRLGAGLVTVAVPEPLLTAVEVGSVESMSLPLPADEHGCLRADALEALLGAASHCTAAAVGPGLGTSGQTPGAIRALAAATDLPLVLDADGVNAFAGVASTLQGRRGPTVLTPHPGELAHLLGDRSTSDIATDRVAAARAAAACTGAVVALKGQQTVVAAPDGRVAINPTGNAAMASGGSGDVLTGMVGTLLAQGLEAFEATCLAVYLHGLAGDLAVPRLGAEALPASELAQAIPAAVRALRREGEGLPSSEAP